MNIYAQVCPSGYPPERKITSEEAINEYKSISENDGYPKTNEEYKTIIKEKLAEAEFESSDILSEPEISDAIGATMETEAMGDAVGGFFFSVLSSIGSSVEVFDNPSSTDLDKAAATLGWVPILGDILGFIDMGVHDMEMRKHREHANAVAQELNGLERYTSLVKEKHHLKRLKLAAKDALSKSKNGMLNNVDSYLFNYYKETYLYDIQSAIVHTDVLYSDKFIKESKNLTGLINFLKQSMVSVHTSTPDIISIATTTICESENNSSVNFKDMGSQQIDECLSAIFNDYKNYFSDSVSTQGGILDVSSELSDDGGDGIYKLIDSYMKAHNHLLANIKFNTVNQLYKSKKGVNEEICNIYNVHSQQFINDIDTRMKEVARADFFVDNNLSPQGQSKSPACWSKGVTCSGPPYKKLCAWGGCVTTQEFDSGRACAEYYRKKYPNIPSAEGYYCYRFSANACFNYQTFKSEAFCHDYCSSYSIYNNSCGIVTYHPSRDTDLIEAKNELTQKLTQEYQSCLTSHKNSHIQFLDILKTNNYVIKTDHSQLFEILFKQIKIEILTEIIDYITAQTIYPLNKVDMTEEFVKSQLDVIKDLTIAVENGRWARYIDLPIEGIQEGRVLKVARYSTWVTEVRTGESSVRINRGEVATFTFTNGAWRTNYPQTIYPLNNVDMTEEFVKSQLDVIKDLTIAVENGHWARYIDLPIEGTQEGRVLKVARYSTWVTEVRTGESSVRINRGEVATFTFTNGAWRTNYPQTIYPLNKLDMTEEFVKSQLDVIEDLTIAVENGHWARYIDLPIEGIQEGRVLKVVRYSTWVTEVRTGESSVRINRGEMATFAFTNGVWKLQK
ncbi:hypothetical protein BMR09_05755 [Methylococcaceae bacterium CS3]|nr:hypothetical protein BMR09_05755 [Methylococcaceae bacterium CS3]